MLRKVLYVLLASLALVASQTPCHTRQDAMNIAEIETRGEAVAARRIEMNGATGGWEVMVRMPGQERGWRVFIDRDNGKVRRKEPCPNPPERRRRHKGHASHLADG